jgi:hypothetical protein
MLDSMIVLNTEPLRAVVSQLLSRLVKLELFFPALLVYGLPCECCLFA